ncbi:MAG: PIN domain-containing protein [Myxococcales bacterium]|nr:PIN domain-containing protein [Myxococcales bacterium]
MRRRRNCIRLAPGPGNWKIFSDLCRKVKARGKLVADAYHAALAIEHGCEWMAADADYACSPGLRWRHPLQ